MTSVKQNPHWRLDSVCLHLVVANTHDKNEDLITKNELRYRKKAHKINYPLPPSNGQMLQRTAYDGGNKKGKSSAKLHKINLLKLSIPKNFSGSYGFYLTKGTL